jgi:hypothetical protein
MRVQLALDAVVLFFDARVFASALAVLVGCALVAAHLVAGGPVAGTVAVLQTRHTFLAE